MKTKAEGMMKVIEITYPKSRSGDCRLIDNVGALRDELSLLFYKGKDGEIVQLRVKEMTPQEYQNLSNLHEWPEA